MAVAINETFTGADGTSPANFIPGYDGTGALSTIESNTWRLRTVGGNTYNSAYQITRKWNGGNVDDFDEIFEIWDGDSNEKHIYFHYRASGANFDGQYGYGIWLSTGSAPELVRFDNFGGPILDTASFTIPAVGTHYWMRVSAIGGTHKVKFWTGSLGAQPTTGGVDSLGNQISRTSESTYTTGDFGWMHKIGNTSATRDFFIDNITSVPSGGALTANAGPDQITVEPWAVVQLDGSGSTGTIVSYAWDHISGPSSNANLSSTTIANPTYMAPALTGGGTDVWRLTVTDAVPSTSTDDVSITVLPPTTFRASGGTWVPLRVEQL